MTAGVKTITSKARSDCKNAPKLVLASILRTLVVEHPTVNCPVVGQIATITTAYNDTSAQPQTQPMGAATGEPGGGEIPMMRLNSPQFMLVALRSGK